MNVDEPNRSNGQVRPPPTTGAPYADASAIAEEGRRTELRKRLEHEDSVLNKLPPTSSYVVHRKKVVRKALQLLTPSGQPGGAGATEADELDRLLAALSLS